jgi:trimethylamine--corrinoid protein Co-methyltransferase
MEPRTRFQIFDEDDLYRLHLATLKVLETTGVGVYEDHCLRLLKDAGATVDEKKRISKIPEFLIKEALGSVPSRFNLYARNPKHNMNVGGKTVYFGAGGPNVPNVLDLDIGERRKPTNKDLVDFARLADALENIHHYGPVTTTIDVQPEVADLHRWAIAFNNTEKPITDGASGRLKAQAFIKMAASISGDLESLRRKPIIMGFGCPVSPLQHPKEALDWLLIFAKEGLPYSVLSEPMIGASSPSTLAGSLVVMNAEILSGIVISQLVKKGTPIIYGANPFPMDMKTAVLCVGAPEVGVAAAISTQLAQYYGIPSLSVCVPDSKMLDAQFGFERAPYILPAMAGCNWIGAAGMIESGLTASLEQMVLDNEFMDMVYRLIRGVELNDETLALDVIDQVGPGGSFLPHPHTLKNAMKEIWYPELFNREDYARWKKDGAKTMTQRAMEKVKRILKEHQPIPLEESIQKEISMIVRETEKLLIKTS